MRPVNLIPPEDRKQKAQVRTGPIAYLLVGALALGLAGVTMLVLTGNEVADHKAEIADLRQQEADAQARAQELAAFTNFSGLEQQRRATVKSLADSRFDWERVMNELALVIPSDVWLTDLTGAASATAGATGADTSGGAAGTSSIAGPSLQLSGCAAGQEAVAGFLSALRDIDGVTRVGLSSSERPTQQVSPGGGGSECRTRDFITKFEIVAAFDAVPAPPVVGAAPTAPVAGAVPATPAPATPADSGAAPAGGEETSTPAEAGS